MPPQHDAMGEPLVTAARADDAFRRFPGVCGGVVREFRRRLRFCGADYTTAREHWPKALSAALFMLFATLFSTVALGALIARQTNHRIGLTEYLLMNSVAGCFHALLGSQPLLVLRPTGPITAIMKMLSQLSDSLHLNFYSYLAATGACVSLLMATVAATEFSRHIRRLTPFTHDIFTCYVCSIYCYDGITDMLARFSGKDAASSFGEVSGVAGRWVGRVRA